MTVPIEIATVIPFNPVCPVNFSTKDASSNVAIAIPDTGLFEEPTRPTIRALTVAKKNPNTAIKSAIGTDSRICGITHRNNRIATIPMITYRIGISRSVRSLPVFP